jgi:predicted glycoside hydrolase/deacetylase ChbG (UPF0249 family)
LSKQLIVNADDFGRTLGISQGILRAYREGIVTSTTAMMNIPGIEESLRLARQESGLGLGVHLVFTAWRPLLPPTQVPSLVDPAGMFWRADAWQTRLDRIDLNELWAEWQAQIAHFRTLAGEPDHLDCHHFIHVYPPIFELYLKLARRENLPARVPFEPKAVKDEATLNLAADLGIATEIVAAIITANRGLMGKQPIRHPDHFIGGFFGNDKLNTERLLSILNQVPDDLSELMCHPGLVDDTLREASSYNWQRERELEILSDPTIKERLESLDIQLVNYKVLG